MQCFHTAIRTATRKANSCTILTQHGVLPLTQNKSCGALTQHRAGVHRVNHRTPYIANHTANSCNKSCSRPLPPPDRQETCRKTTNLTFSQHTDTHCSIGVAIDLSLHVQIRYSVTPLYALHLIYIANPTLLLLYISSLIYI